MAGHIRKRPNGWRVYASRGTDSPTDKRVRICEVVHGSKRDAQRRLRAIQTELEQGSYVSKTAETLNQFVERWFPTKQASVSHTTATSYRNLLDKSILPVMGNKKVQQIDNMDIAAFLSSFVRRGKVSQAEHLWVFLRMMFKAAREMGAISHNPIRGVERPKVPKREMRSLSPREWMAVRDELAVSNPYNLAVLTTMITTGMRRSELCGLQWRDIDFDRSILHIRRAFHHVGGVSTYAEPKTTRSRRAIALDPGTVESLRYVRDHAALVASYYGRVLSDDSPVFSVDGSAPYSPDSISGMWKRVSKKLGIKARLHDLRHTAATLMLANGVPVGDVSDRLGHSTPGFTLTVYRHSVPGAQEEAAARLAGALNGAPVKQLVEPLSVG